MFEATRRKRRKVTVLKPRPARNFTERVPMDYNKQAPTFFWIDGRTEVHIKSTEIDGKEDGFTCCGFRFEHFTKGEVFVSSVSFKQARNREEVPQGFTYCDVCASIFDQVEAARVRHFMRMKSKPFVFGRAPNARADKGHRQALPESVNSSNKEGV